MCASVRSSFSAAPKNIGPSMLYTTTPGGSGPAGSLACPMSSEEPSRWGLTSTASDIRRININAARMTPTLTATTRTTNAVSAKVISSTATSAAGDPRMSLTTCGTSLMFQATTKRMAERQHNGTAEASGDNSRITRIKKPECTSPARGLVAPLRMLVAVRAMAPVEAKPPNKGATILAMPWPSSSWLELCLVPAMPSATTADKSDSIDPSNAIVKAGPTREITCESGMDGSEKEGSGGGIPPNADPIVETPLKEK